jgi:glucan endo-1,6-beta-glucosidase
MIVGDALFGFSPHSGAICFARSATAPESYGSINRYVLPLCNLESLWSISQSLVFFMMLFASVALLALAASPARAWLPSEHREIYARDGTNLFNNTALGGDATSKRWLQASGKVRGVNLGSLFVFEPWLAETEWSNMGCSGQNSEFDCVSHLGQAQANSVFQAHWNSWITQADITQMQSYGLNTIRVPVGYWMMESIVYADSEHFPQGGIGYLEQLCGWASDAGFYIIIDMHGAPGAQVPTNPDTGQVSLPFERWTDIRVSSLLEVK